MLVVEVFDSGAVGNHVTTESEFISQPLSQPIITSGYGRAVIIIVRTHHSENAGFLERGFEGWKQNALDFVRCRLRIGARLSFARSFSDAVNRKVFGR